MVQQRLMQISDIQAALNIRRCDDDGDEASQLQGSRG